ncbi:MAG: nucleoside-diphosphate sugar epimerase/dehydratase [Paludibacteraceae bacterium]
MKNLWQPIKTSDIFSHFTSLAYLPRWVVFIGDIIVCVFSYTLSYLLVSRSANDLTNPIIINNFWLRMTLLVSVQILFFWIFHTYSGILRYSGFVDAIKLFFAVFSVVGLCVLVNLITFWLFDVYVFYFISLIFYGVIAFFLLFMIRLTVKTAFELIAMNVGDVMPVMIYGTKSAGISIAKMLRTSDRLKYKLVGFVDMDKVASQRVLMGVKVYELTDRNVKEVISRKAKAIIVSPFKMESADVQKELDLFINYGLSVLVAPPVSIWDKHDMPSLRQIKSVQIEDLLDRPQIVISTENISKEIKDKVILITGAAGSIGSEIVRQLVTFKPRMIVLVDQAETPMHELTLRLRENYPQQTFSAFLADVRNIDRMDTMMSLYRPDIVFHAAAYKHVPLMEDNPTESIQVNVLGTKNVADLAVKYNVSRFVMVSTDKAVNPTNIMGASKRIAEIYVQSLNKNIEKKDDKCTRFITTRFGNVLGSNGSVIPFFKHQIENGGPVTVTHPEIIRYFMTIPEACLLVLEAGTMGEGGEIYIFDMGQPVKILDLARKMIRLAGYVPDVDIHIKFTGLRPGEKLYEELLNTKEITQKTYHPKIMVAKVREYDYDEVTTQIEELIRYSYLGKVYLTVSKMKSIVPEFISNNSEYESLDVKNELQK